MHTTLLRSTNWASFFKRRASTRRRRGSSSARWRSRERLANHPDVDRILTTLANVYQARGQVHGGGELLKRALAIREQTSRCEPPRVGAEALRLGQPVSGQGKYREAEGLLQARAGDQRAGSRCESPRRGSGLNNMAILYEARGESGARLPIRGRQPLPSLPIEPPNSTGTFHRRRARGRSSGTARQLLSAPCCQSSRCGTQGN